MLARTAAVLTVLAAACPAAATAAPTLAPLKGCYVSVDIDPATGQAITENVAVGGRGFTPNSLVDVSIDGVVTVSGAQVDAAGNLPGFVKAPYVKTGERNFSITITEQGNPAQTVTATSKVTALRVDVRPTRARPSSRITFSGRGFTGPRRAVWAHYVKGNRVKKSVKLAVSSGPCGTFKVKRRQFPFNPGTGRWTVQMDQQKRYSKKPNSVFVRLRIDVQRVLRRG